VLAIIVALYLIFGPMWAYARVGPDGVIEEGRASALAAGDAIVIFWSLVIVVLALWGGFAAWWGWARYVWIPAVLLTLFSIISFAIGILVAPIAVLLLASALLLSLDSRQPSTSR
jgi:hypothetical protein